MSDSPSSLALKALRSAREALKQGQRMEARRWCLLALRENANLEEPWLILAAISSPQASVGYLQQALRINPQSERAMAGMQWALNRLASVPSREQLTREKKDLSDTQPVKIERQTQVQRRSRRLWLQ